MPYMAVMSIIPALKKLRQEDPVCKSSLGYILRSCLKNRKSELVVYPMFELGKGKRRKLPNFLKF